MSNWKLWEQYFPGDAVDFKTGVRESITEFFVIVAGSTFLGSTKDVAHARESARQYRDGMGIPDVKIRRISL